MPNCVSVGRPLGGRPGGSPRTSMGWDMTHRGRHRSYQGRPRTPRGRPNCPADVHGTVDALWTQHRHCMDPHGLKWRPGPYIELAGAMSASRGPCTVVRFIVWQRRLHVSLAANELSWLLEPKHLATHQSRRRWFETPLRSLWRHCTVNSTPCSQAIATGLKMRNISRPWPNLSSSEGSQDISACQIS